MKYESTTGGSSRTLSINLSEEDAPEKIELNRMDDLELNYDERKVKRITLPDGLFSFSGKGVNERTSRADNGVLTRGATAFHSGEGTIKLTIVGAKGDLDLVIPCLVK